MKDRLSDYIPLRDVPLALAHSILWFVMLWAFDYPVDDRLGIVVAGYLSLWLSRLIISNLVSFVLRRLHQYALRVVGRESLELIIEESTINVSARARAIVVVLALAIVSATLGLSFVAIPPIVDYAGLTTLGSYFTLGAWVLLGVSAVTLSVLFTLSFKGWSMIEAGLQEPQIPVIRIEQSRGLLKRFGVLAA